MFDDRHLAKDAARLHEFELPPATVQSDLASSTTYISAGCSHFEDDRPRRNANQLELFTLEKRERDTGFVCTESSITAKHKSFHSGRRRATNICAMAPVNSALMAHDFASGAEILGVAVR